MIVELFSAIDQKDADKFAASLHRNCVFRFGNMPEVVGRDEVHKFVADFFDSIASISHEIKDTWSVPDGVICHGQVNYVRKDGSVLSVPFANVLKMESKLITDYLIFADTSKLYC